MAQNIYDTTDFFEGYSRLPRSVHGLDGAPEWASIRAVLPDLRGRRVLDLGCGFGWFCRWARQAGAAQVVGMDLSANMLARARRTTDDPAIEYVQADLDRIELPPATFDLVYSSLALHYVDALERLFGEVHRALVPGGRLVFSAEHPLVTAPRTPGWLVEADGRRRWPIDSYLIEGPRTTDWLAKGVIKHHRTFATYIGLLLRHGFTLAHLEEWGPTDEQVATDPEVVDERDRPTFFFVAARR